jgi:hypothetical protein
MLSKISSLYYFEEFCKMLSKRSCLVCGQSFNSLQEVRVHVTSKHPSVQVADFKKLYIEEYRWTILGEAQPREWMTGECVQVPELTRIFGPAERFCEYFCGHVGEHSPRTYPPVVNPVPAPQSYIEMLNRALGIVWYKETASTVNMVHATEFLECVDQSPTVSNKRSTSNESSSIVKRFR